MRLEDFLKSIKKDPSEMTIEELVELKNKAQQFTRNAKVTIKLDDLFEIIAENETVVYRLINDMEINDDVKYLFIGIFKTYCNMILIEIKERGETTGIKHTTGRW